MVNERGALRKNCPAAATDVCALTTLSVMTAVLARDDPSPPFVGLIGETCPTQKAMFVSQAHLIASCLARGRLSMKTWVTMVTHITTAEKVDESPFHS